MTEQVNVVNLEEAEQEDLELIKICNREDLFSLISSEPEKYLVLIKKHKLENELEIKISRIGNRDDCGLSIKFRIYPTDRWTEVGYFYDYPDSQVYEDFRVQVKSLLGRSRSSIREGQYAHLGSQLDGNNNMLSENYGRDLKGCQLEKKLGELIDKKPVVLGQTGKRSQKKVNQKEIEGEKELKAETKVSGKKGDEKEVSGKKGMMELGVGNLVDEVLRGMDENDRPVEFLNHFVAEMIEKIIESIPEVIKFRNRKYDQLAKELQDLSLMNKYFVPQKFGLLHQELIQKIQSCEYIIQVNKMVDLDRYPELKKTLVEFNREAMKLNPGIYAKLNVKVMKELLDQEELRIIDEYCLDLEEIWKTFLESCSDK